MNNKLLKIAHKFQRSLRNLQLKKFARLKTYNVTALVFGENLSKEPDWTLPDLGRKQITTKSGRPEEIPFLGRIAVDINADSEGNLNIIAGNNILKEWNQTKSIKFPDVISIGKIPQDIQSLSLNSLLESNKLHKLLNEETLADLINSSVFTKTQPFFSGEGYYIFASTDDLENIGYLLLAYQETPLKDIGKPIVDKEILGKEDVDEDLSPKLHADIDLDTLTLVALLNSAWENGPEWDLPTKLPGETTEVTHYKRKIRVPGFFNYSLTLDKLSKGYVELKINLLWNGDSIKVFSHFFSSVISTSLSPLWGPTHTSSPHVSGDQWVKIVKEIYDEIYDNEIERKRLMKIRLKYRDQTPTKP